MTKRNKPHANKIYAALIVDAVRGIEPEGGRSWYAYVKFIRSQSRGNNCYKMALKAIGG